MIAKVNEGSKNDFEDLFKTLNSNDQKQEISGFGDLLSKLQEANFDLKAELLKEKSKKTSQDVKEANEKDESRCV